jgi:hypothetical protein
VEEMSPLPQGIPGKWKLKWDEEFNHGLNPKFASGWLFNKGKPPWPTVVTAAEISSEVACYDPECATVANSILTLSAIKKQQTVDGVDYEYATGFVSSALAKLTVGHGECVEARIWLPEVDGVIANWCSVWLTQNPWPQNGEDDIIESWEGNATSTFHSPSGKPTAEIPGNWSNRWITVASLHSTDGNRYIYYDGKQVGAESMGGVTAEEWVMLTMTLDPSVNPPILVPAEMKIDYVRVWSPV